MKSHEKRLRAGAASMGSGNEMYEARTHWIWIVFEICVSGLMVGAVIIWFVYTNKMAANSSQFQSRIPVYDADDIAPCRYHLLKRAVDPGSSRLMPGLPGRMNLDIDPFSLPQQAQMLQTTSDLTYLYNLYTFLQGFIIFVLALSMIRLIGVQPRLSVIPGSLWVMIPDLFHLAIVTVVLICCLAMALVIVMGPHVQQVSTFSQALMLRANILINGNELLVFDNLYDGRYSSFDLVVINFIHVFFFFLLLALKGMILTIIVAPFSLLIVEDMETMIRLRVQQVRGQAWSNGFLLDKVQDTIKKARKPIFGKLKKFVSSTLQTMGSIRSPLSDDRKSPIPSATSRKSHDRRSPFPSATLRSALIRSFEIKRGTSNDATMSLQDRAFARALVETDARPSRSSKNRPQRQSSISPHKPLTVNFQRHSSMPPAPNPASLEIVEAPVVEAGPLVHIMFESNEITPHDPGLTPHPGQGQGQGEITPHPGHLDADQEQLVHLVRSNLNARGISPSPKSSPLSLGIVEPKKKARAPMSRLRPQTQPAMQSTSRPKRPQITKYNYASILAFINENLKSVCQGKKYLDETAAEMKVMEGTLKQAEEFVGRRRGQATRPEASGMRHEATGTLS